MSRARSELAAGDQRSGQSGDASQQDGRREEDRSAIDCDGGNGSTAEEDCGAG